MFAVEDDCILIIMPFATVLELDLPKRNTLLVVKLLEVYVPVMLTFPIRVFPDVADLLATANIAWLVLLIH